MRRALTCLAAFAYACGSDPAPIGKDAKILEFTADPTTVDLGDEVTLRWQTLGASGINIEPRVGLGSPIGEARDRPLIDTVYVLTIPGNDEVSAEVEVIVKAGPRIQSFDATPRTIAEGETAMLAWASSDAEAVLIEPGVGRQAASGMIAVAPIVTTTYRAIAVRGDEQSTPGEITVLVASGNGPRIEVFRATPDAIQSGSASTLSWDVKSATSVSIDNGVGPQDASGSILVTPNQTTNYTLTAVGPGGQASASVSVSVAGSGVPAVLAFTATPDTIAAGGSAELAWDTDNTDEVEINPGSTGRLEAKGMLEVSPSQTTTYQITAFSFATGMNATRDVIVTVVGANQPVVNSFVAQPAAIAAGASTTLTWATQNATSVDIDQGVGTGLLPNGSIQVSPSGDTVYRLTARSSTGMAVADVTVTIVAAQPTIISFVAQPASINAGQSANLSWTTSDATSVTIDQGVGPQPANGSVTVSPAQTTTYQITATGPGGTANGMVVVSVSPPGAPSIGSFSATPLQISAGAQSTLSWSVSNATTVTIDNGVGAQSATGSVQVSPGATTNYTLTAVGPGGQATARTTVTVVTLGDTCGDAIAAASGTYSGNTLTASNDYQASNGCTGFASTGPDIVYRLQLQAGDRLQASLTPTNGSWDASIYLLTGCADVAGSCIAGQDNGNPEQIDATVLSSGDYYLVIDGFGGAGGTYALEITVGPAPIANDLCAGAIAVGSGGSWSGDTTSATHQYTPLATGFGGCTGYTAAGNDVVYQVTLAAAERLQASLDATWDASLYLISSCASPTTTCLAGQDNGNPEQIDYTAASAGTYFLIVDGYNTAKGPFALTVSVSPPVAGGDTCQAAVQVPAGGGSFQSTTVGLANDYQPPLACTGYTQDGPDQAYAITLQAGDIVEATADFEAGHDGAIYIVSSCSTYASCVGADIGVGGDTESLRFVASTTGVHDLIVDAVGAAESGTHDLTITRYGGDICADAAPLDVSGVAESLVTTGKANDYSPPSSGCTGHTAAGPDRVYSHAVSPGDQLEVVFDPDGFDGSLYVVTNCADLIGSCAAGSDVGVTNNETVAPVFQQSGTAFVIVDGYGTGAGNGTILGRVRRGDTCADAYVVPPGGGTFRGTTSGYAANYGIAASAGSCTGFSQTGADAVYAINLGPNQMLSATVTTTWDAALYLIRDCANAATTCVAGQDDGNPESIQYTNGATATTYYLVVDAWQPSSGGTQREGAYTLTITAP